MIKTIKQIFRFGHENPHMVKFFERIPNNIQKFIDDKYRVTSEMEDLSIDVGILVEIVFACVNWGFDEEKKVEKIE